MFMMRDAYQFVLEFHLKFYLLVEIVFFTAYRNVYDGLTDINPFHGTIAYLD
jgi:hypothetical protein